MRVEAGLASARPVGGRAGQWWHRPRAAGGDRDERGIRAGAVGGKLLGAGGGGFLLFFCEPEQQSRLREELSDLRELSFAMDPEGSKVVYIGGDRV